MLLVDQKTWVSTVYPPGSTHDYKRSEAPHKNYVSFGRGISGGKESTTLEEAKEVAEVAYLKSVLFAKRSGKTGTS